MKSRTFLVLIAGLAFVSFVALSETGTEKSGEDLKGAYGYDEFDRPESCRQCHTGIYYQWKQSMMAQAYTHHWDEIEYFDLAVEHAKRDPDFKDAVDGCNGCHAPLAYMAGDVPPPRPEKKPRANESVSCEVCHNISGYDESKLYNYSYYMDPGEVKYGTRGGNQSSIHKSQKAPHIQSAKFCANCHNEKSPFGADVKSTYTEWKNGPYSDEGVQCQVCHMPAAPGVRSITEGKEYDDVRQHLFHGAHVPAKTNGAIDVLVQPSRFEYEPADKAVFTVQLFNQKAGHKIPTGSVEDRLLYLHVEATDANGKTYHLKVDKKGFEGEEYTIASDDAKAYQDFKDMMDVPEDFDGLPRDGVPEGDRIFRMPYFTKEGIMTICQWNTAKLGVDYRIGPRETKVETFSWYVPDEVAEGTLKVRAQLRYKLLVKPVADFLDVPEDESKDRTINTGETEVEIYY